MMRRLLLLLSAAGAACDAGGPGLADHPPLDGEAALALVETQVAFGPRVPGTPGHAAQLAWMIAHLDSLAPDVAADTFSHVTRAGDTLTLTNVLARFRPELTRRIVLLAHWDTRPTSDEAADPTLRDTPIPGANDGASGTAVLLELARVFAAQPPPLGVDLLFVDGEDYGPEIDDMLLGAKRYASTLPDQGRPIYGVLLDMVGDRDPLFPMEGYSAQAAPIVVRKVWDAARRLGYEATFPETASGPVGDDHVPLIQAGLPTVVVIDLQYGPGNAWWHTAQDTPDKLSAETLRMVGEVMAELVYSGG
ncbi:MAG: glutamine cyclotransferase [Gemmatimonadota bacterium]